MSLFICEQCGQVENTATSRYWFGMPHGHLPLCGDCDPEMPKNVLREMEGPDADLSWKGQVVLNPEIIGRFHKFKADPDKCSHLALPKAGQLHIGAKTICPSCGSLAEIIDVGKERRKRERDSMYIAADKKWKI